MEQDELAKHRGCTTLPFEYEKWRRGIPYEPGEIDYEQPVNQMIRLNARTRDFIYGDYTPLRAGYEAGTRPKLERHVAMAVSNARDQRDRALAVMEWANRKVTPPRGVKKELAVHGGTEEDFLERGYGVCNEVSRVFVTLCQVAGIAARMTFHWSEDGRYGHSLSEAYVEGKWTLFDAEINVSGFSVGGLQANCWEMMTDPSTAKAFDGIVTREMLDLLGLGDPSGRYSDLFRVMGVCNYPIESFPYKLRRPR